MTDALEFKPNLTEAVERMRRLWALEDPLDRVPMCVRIPYPAKHPKKADGTFFGRPEDYLEEMEAKFAAQALVPDESFPMVHPQYGHALISALCGSPIRAAAETVWSIPIINDLGETGNLHLDWDNEWGTRFRADCDLMLERARGRYAVGTYEVEGVSDTMSALFGAEKLLYAFYDDPEGVQRFATRVTDLLIEFGRWNSGNIGAPQDLLGGEVCDWSLWMPQNSCATTEDASVLYSPDCYRQFIQEHDRRLSGAFTRTLIEVHKEGNHQIAAFGEVDGISMLTIQNPLDMQPAHREAVRNLLGKKIFYIGVKPDQIEDLLRFTGLRGVLLVSTASSVNEARKILAQAETLTAIRPRGGGVRSLTY
ncbi:MAG: hypothetical protein JXR37_10860 [Kiritimatiellae bacterium]|nr:hypothetical protein [Kiritimatiellia bacterium]